jgi:hypothetical protein
MAADYDSRGVEGTIRLLRGVQQNVRGAVGTFTGSPPTIVNGYRKNYFCDLRLMKDAPQYFPTTGQYELDSWLE